MRNHSVRNLRNIEKKLSVVVFVSLGSLAAACSGSGSGGNTTSSAYTAAQCSAASAWAPNTSYTQGELVTYQGTVYSCVQAHTSLDGWTPQAVPALWQPADCQGPGSGGSGGSAGTGGTGGSSGCGGSGGSGGAAGSGGTGGTGGSAGGGTDAGTGNTGNTGNTGSTGTAPASLVFSPYKDTSINMNWNTNVISTSVSGTATPLATDLTQNGAKTITLAFATGECGSENWAGVQGPAMATANVSLLTQAGVNYVLSTGGAAGSFTCGSDSGFETFLGRWASSNLIGVDFDIEAGQSQAVIGALVSRIQAAHAAHPGLRFSLTLATLANNDGASSAQSLGSGAPDSFNTYGDWAMSAVESVFGWSGASSWPSYLTVDLMTMDYGSPSDGVCVVSGGSCEMGQSALQAAYNLHDHWGVPWANIELTPMIGGNDVSSEQFTLADADTIAQFAIQNQLAGIHYWSYDRDDDCAPGSASPTCNSLGNAGSHGFLKRFLGDGLH